MNLVLAKAVGKAALVSPPVKWACSLAFVVTMLDVLAGRDIHGVDGMAGTFAYYVLLYLPLTFVLSVCLWAAQYMCSRRISMPWQSRNGSYILLVGLFLPLLPWTIESMWAFGHSEGVQHYQELLMSTSHPGAILVGYAGHPTIIYAMMVLMACSMTYAMRSIVD